MKFREVPIGAAFDVRNGATPASGEPSYWNGDIPWVGPADLGKLKSRTIERGERSITPEGYESCGTQMVPAGSIILSIRAPIGHMAIASQAMCFNQGCRGLVPRQMVSSQFAFWALSACKPLLEAAGQGTTFVELGRDKLRAERIPLPDLPTQKAIADFLDRETVRIDQLIEKKGRLVEALQSKRISLISEAVTTGIDDSLDLVETNSQFVPKVPHGWKLWRLKHLADVRGGLTIGRAVPIERPVIPVSYLRVANVQAGWIDLSDVAETHVTSAEVEKYSLAEGDVLMNEGGDNDKLGRGAVWTAPFHPCLHQNHVFCVRPRERHYAEWISLATNAQYARDFFFLHSNQSTNLASISRSNLQQFPVAIPPHGEMRDLLSRVHAALARIDRVISAVRTSIEGLREFRSALITAAVTGQMDVTTWGRRGETDRRLERIEEEMSAAPGRGEVVAAS